jgi:alpha-tubulin suppressor-like RCC1 family protein
MRSLRSDGQWLVCCLALHLGGGGCSETRVDESSKRDGGGQLAANQMDASAKSDSAIGPVDGGAMGVSTTRLSAGAGHTCAVAADTCVYCWGSNDDAELGDNATEMTRGVAGKVIGVTNAIGVSAGSYHTCALTADRRVLCWGWNSYGQVGDGSMVNRPTAFELPEPSGVIALATGGFHTCVLQGDGMGQCWGQNSLGQLGDGSETDTVAPVGVFSLPPSMAISAAGRHTCTVVRDGVNDGTVQCWGANESGELGTQTETGGQTDDVEHFPLPVPGVSNAVAIAAGFNHMCALTNAGGVVCWGANDSGQLGDGTFVGRATPLPVQGLGRVAAIAAGYEHTCAILEDNTVRCWGSNTAGQVGDGTTTDRPTPMLVPGISATAIAGGSVHTCAATIDGAVYCWGSNDSGELGDGTLTNRTSPVRVVGLPSDAE